jgi:3-oxoadipate enol-lactonase/4-carboxymuconolactone decarboxylase
VTLRWISAPDGTRIAYSAQGQGPAVLLTNGLTTSIAFWKYLAPRWAETCRVITWDLPGHGRSHRPNTLRCMDIASQPAIMARILDAEGVQRAAHVGLSVGCQIALEMARQEPSRCTALGLLLGTAGRVFDTLELPVGRLFPKLLLKLPKPVFAAWYALMMRAVKTRNAGPIAKRLGLVGPDAKDADVLELAEHLTTLEPASLQRMAQSSAAHDASDVLAALKIPVLAVAGGRDPFAPLDTVGRVLAGQNPRVRLVVLPRGTHTAMLDSPEPIVQAVAELLAEVRKGV